MARVLSALERSVLLGQVHPELQDEIYSIDPLNSMRSDLAYPRSGRAVRWPDDSYTLVWRDASGAWWFVDVTEHFAGQVNKPDYVSPDASFLKNIINETLEMVRDGAQAAVPVLSGAVVLGVLVAVLILRK